MTRFRWLGVVALAAAFLSSAVLLWPRGDVSGDERSLLEELRGSAECKTSACPRCLGEKHATECYLCEGSGMIVRGNNSFQVLVQVLVDRINRDYFTSEFARSEYEELAGMSASCVPLLLDEWYVTKPAVWSRRAWSVPHGFKVSGAPYDFVKKLVAEHGDAAVPWLVWFVEQGRNKSESRMALDVIGKLASQPGARLLGRVFSTEMSGIPVASYFSALARCGDAQALMQLYGWCRACESPTELIEVVDQRVSGKRKDELLSLLSRTGRRSLNPEPGDDERAWKRIQEQLSGLTWDSVARLWK